MEADSPASASYLIRPRALEGEGLPNTPKLPLLFTRCKGFGIFKKSYIGEETLLADRSVLTIE